MKVAMYYSNRDIRTEEMTVPEIGADEVLVKVAAAGICGSDVMEWYRRDRVPLVLGHEVSGVVAKTGSNVTAFQVGERVTAAHHVPCNTCHYCLSGHPTMCRTISRTNFDPGGFAQYFRLAAINVEKGLFKLPDTVSDEAATFVEPLACVLRAQQSSSFQVGQSVLIIGSGITGLLHLKLAKALGASRIFSTDVNEYRLEKARQYGATAVFQAKNFKPSMLKEQNKGYLADLVILCTGAVPAIRQAIASVEKGGTILIFAPTAEGVTIPLSLNELFWKRDLTITTTYAASPADYMTALELIATRRVSVEEMITHRLSISEAAKGFELVVSAGDSIKVIIEPQR